MMTAIPESIISEAGSTELAGQPMPSMLTQNDDPVEAALEAAEIGRYLLAKSLFDCREYDRCAAVFLPDSLLASVVSVQPEDRSGRKDHLTAVKTVMRSSQQGGVAVELPEISQKSLFLALYAKMISGEKRKDEDAEMVMGPHDLGNTVNRQLRAVSAYLSQWFAQNANEEGDAPNSQGWLEYL